jgi:hypothetical protein
MQWHIINHRDYIDGPFDTLEMALQVDEAASACAAADEGILRLQAAV